MNVSALGTVADAVTREHRTMKDGETGFSAEMLRQLAASSLERAKQIEDAAGELQKTAGRQDDIAGLLNGVIQAAQAFADSLNQAREVLEVDTRSEDQAAESQSVAATQEDGDSVSKEFDSVLPRIQQDFDNWWKENYFDAPSTAAQVGKGVWIGDMYLELVDRRGNAHVRDADGKLLVDDFDHPIVVRPGQDVQAVAAKVPGLLNAWEEQYEVRFPDAALVMQGREPFTNSVNSDLYNAMGNWELARGLNTAGWALSPGTAMKAVAAGGSRPYLNSDLSVNQDWVVGSAEFDAKMAELASLIRDNGALSQVYLDAVRT